MGRTVSFAPGYAPEDEDFDPSSDDFISQERSYRHFDRPVSEADRSGIRLTEDAILRNSFWPLLSFKKVERRVKRDKKSGSVSFKEKIREIRFCSHQDAALLERYASWLSEKYEASLVSQGLSPTVLAYRKGVGNNITQAKLLFDEIRRNGDVIAIALDISGFFDNIRHDVLRNSLNFVTQRTPLSAADFKIYKRMTQFEWVEADDIEVRLAGKKRPAGRICDAYQFRSLIRKKGDSLVKRNSARFGIPQGTPLSGLYANISMLSFDSKLHDHFSACGALYRRYSDDMAVILPKGSDPQKHIQFVETELRKIGLSLSDAKTEISTFELQRDGLVSDKPFQYLGFTFDGKKTLIRQSSLNRYYAKMKSGVLAKVVAAKKNKVHPSNIYMRELFRKYTHFGKYRNFPRYAYRSSIELSSPHIRRQLSNHFEIFKEIVRLTIAAVY